VRFASRSERARWRNTEIVTPADEPSKAGAEDRRWRPSPDVVHQDLRGEIVLVHLQTNRIYSLNPTGARLWALLVEGRSQDEIKQQLLEEFEVAEDELDREMAALLSSLRAEQLVVDVES
jgi:hypothetical protein